MQRMISESQKSKQSTQVGLRSKGVAGLSALERPLCDCPFRTWSETGSRKPRAEGPRTDTRAKVLRQREGTSLSRKHQRGHSGRTQGEVGASQDGARAAGRGGES